jgi:hypothetical protein
MIPILIGALFGQGGFFSPHKQTPDIGNFLRRSGALAALEPAKQALVDLGTSPMSGGPSSTLDFALALGVPPSAVAQVVNSPEAINAALADFYNVPTNARPYFAPALTVPAFDTGSSIVSAAEMVRQQYLTVASYEALGIDYAAAMANAQEAALSGFSAAAGGVIPGDYPGQPRTITAHAGEEYRGVGQYRRSDREWGGDGWGDMDGGRPLQVNVILDGRKIAETVVKEIKVMALGGQKPIPDTAVYPVRRG